MILLLPQPEEDNLSELEFRNVRLSELATSIRIGETPRSDVRPVAGDHFAGQAEGPPVVMLKMTHFRDGYERIDWSIVQGDLKKLSKFGETMPVDAEVLIEPDDILISLRGQHRVIRITESMMEEMPEDDVQLGLRLAATNNFILMRPDQKSVYPPFLELVMEILLDDVSREWLAVMNDQSSANLLHEFLRWKRGERMGSSRPANTPIGARELNRLSVDIPSERWAQREWCHRYNLLVFQERLAVEKKNLFRSDLSQYINPNFKK